MTDPKHPDVTPRLPENDVRVDFGKPAPGSANPMPADVVLAYEERIRNSAEAQVAGAEKALKLFIG